METPAALTSLTALGHESRLAAFRTLVQVGPAGLASASASRQPR